MGVELATREPSSLVEINDQCQAVEAWAAECSSIPELQDASNRLAAINEYLLRTSKDGRARVAAATRRLELRIGDLLGPAVPNGRYPDSRIAREQSEMEPRRVHEFRRFAANRDIVEATIATSSDKAPATRVAVVRAIAAHNAEKVRALAGDGLTQRAIAETLGVQRSFVSKLLGPERPAMVDLLLLVAWPLVATSLYLQVNALTYATGRYPGRLDRAMSAVTLAAALTGIIRLVVEAVA